MNATITEELQTSVRHLARQLTAHRRRGIPESLLAELERRRTMLTTRLHQRQHAARLLTAAQNAARTATAALSATEAP